MSEKEIALNIAKKAGKIIRSDFTLGMKREWKEDNTPLTQTDLTINQLAIDELQNHFPEDSVIAEEGNKLVKGSERTWVCDPVDGTIPFSHGIPTSVFSLALVQDGESILGVVYDPFMERMFVAEKGKGAFLNNKKIAVSSAKTLQSSLVGITWSQGHKYTSSEIAEMFNEQQAKILNVASIIYMGVLVACGEFAAAVYTGNKAHDSASLKIIVEEAGGRVTDIVGNEQRYDQAVNGQLLTNNILHKEILKLIKPHLHLNSRGARGDL